MKQSVRPFLLYTARKKFPHFPAIVHEKRQFNYEEYFSTSWRLKTYLQRSFKLQKGDKVALLLENSPIYAFLVMALQMWGAMAVHLSRRFPDKLIGELLPDIFADQKIKILLTDQETGREAYQKNIKAVDVRRFFRDDFTLNIPPPPEEHPMEKTSAFDEKEALIPLDQSSDIIFTSASTDRPKAVVHSYGNHYYSALGSNSNIAFKPDDLWQMSLPLFHVGGLSVLYRAALAGAGILFADEPETCLFKFNVTHISLVPTQLYRLLKNPKLHTRLSRLKAILLGGAQIPNSLLQRAKELRLNLYSSYGSSEMSSQIATTLSGNENKYLDNAGEVLPFREIKLSPEREVLVKGACLFKGYYHKNKLHHPLDEEGYFHTGDLGEFDEHGGLKILGRKDNMFISGGENIQPEEIERYLEDCLYIETAYVVGVSDPEFGKRPAAFVKLNTSHAKKDDLFSRISQELRENLPGFKIPIRYFELPPEKGLKHNRKDLLAYAEKHLK